MPLPVHSTAREDIDSLQQTTLDPPTPEAWQELRALGHRMLDDVFDDLASAARATCVAAASGIVRKRGGIPASH